MVVVDKDNKHFYIDTRLSLRLDNVIKLVQEDDRDFFFVIDGEEGSGKSVLAMQLATYCDPTFCLERVVFNSKEFKDAVLAGTKGQAIVFDEAFRGLSSRAALTEMNKLLVTLMMECRQRNLIIFIVLPTVFMLDKYVALHRARILFHCYQKHGRRGFWICFGKEKMKLLFLKGKATYSYSWPKSDFLGSFLKQYTVNEEAYREKKRNSFNTIGKSTKSELYMEQRNILLWYINKRLGKPIVEIANDVDSLGWIIDQSTIGQNIVAKDKTLKEAGLVKE